MNPKIIVPAAVVLILLGWPLLQEEGTESSNTLLSILAVALGIGYQAWRARQDDGEDN